MHCIKLAKDATVLYIEQVPNSGKAREHLSHIKLQNQDTPIGKYFTINNHTLEDFLIHKPISAQTDIYKREHYNPP